MAEGGRWVQVEREREARRVRREMRFWSWRRATRLGVGMDAAWRRLLACWYVLLANVLLLSAEAGEGRGKIESTNGVTGLQSLDAEPRTVMMGVLLEFLADEVFQWVGRGLKYYRPILCASRLIIVNLYPRSALKQRAI